MIRTLLATVLAIAIAAPAAAWTPVPPPWKPTITDVSPPVGRPHGGQVVRLTGTGLRPPVRVFFLLGGGEPVEAFVVELSDRHVTLITPAVAFAEGEQYRVAEIEVESDGVRVKAPKTFLYENELLRPEILASVPTSGRVGTRVTLLGDAFQAPVQVLFGSQEARVLSVTRNEIVVEAPEGCGTVDITVRNIGSGTESTTARAFRYFTSPRCGRRGMTKPPRAESAASTADESVVTRKARTND